MTFKRRRSEGGQSLVEFALLLPLMIVLLLAIIDFARIYTTMMGVESAAREAADWGANGSVRWQTATYAATRDEMNRRACVAASNLVEYAGSRDRLRQPRLLSLPDIDRWRRVRVAP